MDTTNRSLIALAEAFSVANLPRRDVLKMSYRNLGGWRHGKSWPFPLLADHHRSAIEQAAANTMTRAAEGYSFSMRPTTAQGCLPVVIVRWPRLASHLVRRSGREVLRNAVAPAAERDLQGTLGRMPAPTILARAGADVWAGWRLRTALTTPMDVAATLQHYALMLGGLDLVTPSRPGDLDLPVFGAIRNWNDDPAEQIALEIDPFRVYDLPIPVSAAATPVLA